MGERTLERTIRRACTGDPRAFGRLYDEYADRIYAFVRSRVSPAEDAEDVTATVFMKAYEAIGSYDDRGLPFSAWLFRIARNAIVDHYRRSERVPTPTEDLSEADAEVSGPEQAAVLAADRETLRAAVRQLTDEQAAVIALRFWWDSSLEETALALGKNTNAIKALQHRAVRSLARILGEAGDDEV